VRDCVAVREYQTDVGPVDYALFLGGKAVGVAEAKREEEGQKLSAHETQVEDYATAKLKRINNEPLPFIYLSTGVVRRFIPIPATTSPVFRKYLRFTVPKPCKVGTKKPNRSAGE
jgi:type I restriction enzyme R subunit